jgi:hypothetical protein
MRCYCWPSRWAATPAPDRGAGIYRDKLRRVDGQWLFTDRHVTVDT